MAQKLFKQGDVRADGFIFANYKTNGKPHWYSPDAFHRNRLHNINNLSKARAQAKGLPHNLDVDYLAEIYPADGKCPALGIKLVWGTSVRSNSPSLDRIVPHKGYVRGNVRWLSDKANRIKSDATPEEVERVAKFLRKNDY